MSLVIPLDIASYKIQSVSKWHRYSVTVNPIMTAYVQLSKELLQLYILTHSITVNPIMTVYVKLSKGWLQLYILCHVLQTFEGMASTLHPSTDIWHPIMTAYIQLSKEFLQLYISPQIFHNGKSNIDSVRSTFEGMTPTLPLGIHDAIASLQDVIPYQLIHDSTRKRFNIV